MCGIFGVLSSNLPNNVNSLMNNALSTLRHRGPNDSGVWSDLSSGVVLGHTRLSILDLTVAGHQPMVSLSGRYIIIFNGEIYNHQSLRKELQKIKNEFIWKGGSDTETLLACFDTWGVEKTFKKIVGMFAIALWDVKKRKLILSRDRFGEKPLYYGYSSGLFVFSSELKAIKAMPNFHGEINRDALSNYLRYLYVPTPQCIFNGLSKLEAGTWIEISLNQVGNHQLPDPKVYWSALEQAIIGENSPIEFSSDEEAINKLDYLLSSSIKGQMLSDVPLGAFLSGGVDSSTIVALMQSQSKFPVQTFSIGFDEKGFNEAQYAKSVAKHLGTNHTELYVQSQDAIDVIPSLSEIYDEPFADASQIPTYLVSKLAKSSVTVALSGDGGDELFGGYNRYFFANGPWKKIEYIPLVLRKYLARAIVSVSPSKWDSLYRIIQSILPAYYNRNQVGSKIHKVASIVGCSNEEELYHRLTQLCNPSDFVLGLNNEPLLNTSWSKISHPVSQMMVADATNYLVDDILVKVDRAAMSVSLETRVPLLDHRIYEFASQLPYNYKFRNGTGKWILKELLYHYVPKTLIDRPKMGFGIPIDEWLRGPLREWGSDLLNPARLKNEGYLNHIAINKKWDNHMSGSENHGLFLWGVLMFESWLEENKF